MKRPSVTLLLPAWNEEACVERALTQGHAALSGLGADFEILLVDDGSTDRTREVAQRLRRRLRQVRLVGHQRNRGLGAALRTGFAAARKEIVAYSDVDLPFDLGEIGRALHLMEYLDADLLCGFRLDRTSEGPRRILYSFAYNWLVRSLFGVRVKDINFSCKLIRRRVLEGIELKSEGSFIDAELVVKAARAGFRVAQFGVDYFPRSAGDSTLSSPRVIGTILRELARLYPEMRGAAWKR